jgi:glutamate-ammonia-ligase adenylyltransferase
MPPQTGPSAAPALAAHSRFVQRIRRRYAAELPCCRRARPMRRRITALVQRLQQGGRDLASALRVARQLVLERLAVLDVEQAARWTWSPAP